MMYRVVAQKVLGKSGYKWVQIQKEAFYRRKMVVGTGFEPVKA
jgi:hypothetical protein